MNLTSTFLDTVREFQKEVHHNSKSHGFWNEANGPDNVNIPAKLCLIHSEISEALEAYRKGNPPCEKKYEIPAVSGSSQIVHLSMCSIAEELADAFIRILDLSEHLKIDLAKAALVKHAYNQSRPLMHGKKC